MNVQLGPLPKWQFTDNTFKPLINGRIYTYRDLARQEYKPIYQDPAGLIPYPAPYATLDGTGSIGPIYWLTDENYYVVITDKNGNPYYTIEAYHPEEGSVSPVTVSLDLMNLFINPQFDEHYQEFYTQNNLVNGDNYIAGKWHLHFSNRTATDRVDFVKILPASLPTNIEGDPRYYFKYTCTAAGSGETWKDFYQYFKGASSFSGQPVKVAFVGQSDVGSTVEVRAKVDYGSGGSPADDYLIDTITLDSTFKKYFSTTFTMPLLTGKTIGKNNDDYVQIYIRLPLNTTSDVKLTNMQLNLTQNQLPFNYITYDETNINLRAEALPIPNIDPYVDDDKVYTAKGGKHQIQLLMPVPVGSSVMWFTDFVPDGWLCMYGQDVGAWDLKRLYNVVGGRWGLNNYNQGGGCSNLSGATFRFSNFGNGAIPEAWSQGTTGFTINVVQTGDSTHPHIVDITCTSAAAYSGGEYITFSMPNGSLWAVWLKVGGNGIRPNLSGRDIPFRAIYLNEWDDAAAVASKFFDALNPLVFGIIDTRGYFPRVRDGGYTNSGWISGSYTGRDPDIATRTPPVGLSGSDVGSTQGDENKSHFHSGANVYRAWASEQVPRGDGGLATWGPEFPIAATLWTTGLDGGSEARPKNFDYVQIIKY